MKNIFNRQSFLFKMTVIKEKNVYRINPFYQKLNNLVISLGVGPVPFITVLQLIMLFYFSNKKLDLDI